MTEADESIFKKAMNYNFEVQEALGRQLRDESLKWAQGSEVPKNIRKAIWGLATAYFKFHDDDSLEYLVCALEDEIEQGSPILHEVDLRLLAEKLKSLQATVDRVKFETDGMKSEIVRLLRASIEN